MNKIYQGESLNLVFKCRDQEGNPVSLDGMTVAVMLRDGMGEVACRFSTDPSDGVMPALVDGQYVVCNLDKFGMSVLSGRYVLEAKVTQGDLVMIDIVKGIKINGSQIGQETEL